MLTSEQLEVLNLSVFRIDLGEISRQVGRGEAQRGGRTQVKANQRKNDAKR
jgi:hypothetical protein